MGIFSLTKIKKKWGTNFSPLIHEYILVQYGHTHKGFTPVWWGDHIYYMTEEEAHRNNHYISVYTDHYKWYQKKDESPKYN